jgi:hypothetical protein
MKRNKLIELLKGIELYVSIQINNNVSQTVWAKLTSKSCEDIADFVEEEKLQASNRKQHQKARKGKME